MPVEATPRILDTYIMSASRFVKNRNMAKLHSLADLDDTCLYSFLDNEEEDGFYNLHTPTLMPSEDIWKKFELLPTPPRSPKHEVQDLLDLESTDISDFLNHESVLKPPNLPFPESPPNSNLCSKLIQDCMWSGSHHLESVVSAEKSASVGSSTQTENGHVDPPSDCVDPASVFPYPISDTRLTSLGTETPSDSEEEIDVVSTEDIQESRIPSPKTVSINLQNVKTMTVKTESAKREAKSVHVVIGYPDLDVHNYSLPHSHAYKRTRSSPVQTSTPKRIKRELSEPDLKRVCQKLKASKSCSSRNNSDSEEGGEGKRTQHNVLERKRRNDLKYSFYTLRDSVPELKEREKAPKVLILKKSSDYIYELRKQESTLAKEVAHLKDKHEKLRRTLSALRR